MPTIDLPDFSGETIGDGRYRLLNVIGVGGFGVVYRARERIPDSTLSINRAIKMTPLYSDGTEHRVTQNREVSLHRVVSNLPNVVTMHGVLRQDGYQFMVMDYHRGGDLGRIIKETHTFARNEPLLREIFLQIVDAVEACHVRGVYHRDLKPENILVNDGLTEIYIADFGLATHLRQSTAFNIGTRHYESPECVDCDDEDYPYDTRRSDIWALGIILIQLVTGRVLWETATIKDRHFVRFLENENFLRTIFPITAELNGIIRRILTMRPQDACTLPELRRLIRNLDRFWLTEKEAMKSEYPAVWEMWREYSPNGDLNSELSGSWDLSSDWESRCGDVLESDTSSESGGSLEDNIRDFNSNDREDEPRQLPAVYAQGPQPGVQKGVPPPLPPRPQPKPQPQRNPLEAFDDLLAVDLPAIMQSVSSDEFPIRRPGRSLAAMGPPGSSSSSSSDADSSGPNTPPTRPHDLPAIITTQNLLDAEEVPLQAVPDGAEGGKMTGVRRMSLVLWNLIYGRQPEELRV